MGTVFTVGSLLRNFTLQAFHISCRARMGVAITDLIGFLWPNIFQWLWRIFFADFFVKMQSFVVGGLTFVKYNETIILVPENFTIKQNEDFQTLVIMTNVILLWIDLNEIVGWSAKDYVLSEGTWIWLLCGLLFGICFGGVFLRHLLFASNLREESYSYAEDEKKAIDAMATKPFPASQLSNICAKHRKYEVLFKVEFQIATKGAGHAMRAGLKEENEGKNQNKNIIPYDYNRVVLPPIPSVPDSDYVNASFVDSLITPKAYIVAQGPNENSIDDFWRMIWHQKIRLIVMLTKTFDFIKVMCVQYWPAQVGLTDEYSGLKIHLVKEEQLANFKIRTMRLTKLGEDEEHEIVQFHYTEWPSHSNPFAISLLEYRRRIRIWIKGNLRPSDGPILVHCNDGGGRSGVYLAVDSNIGLYEEDGLFDIYGYLKKMRQARKGLVENIKQYQFIFDVLEEYLYTGITYFPVSELSTRLKQKSVKIEGNKNEYQIEFEKICKMASRFTIGDCAAGHRGDNRFKNRNVLCVPPDNYRPYLTTFQGNNCTDYINAVFVDGYVRIREYIVTEWPLRNTISDIWSLIYDLDIAAVVVLCNPGNSDPEGYAHPHEYIVTEWPLPNTMKDLWALVYDHDCFAVVILASPDQDPNFPPFWPDRQQIMKYEPAFTVERLSQKDYHNIRSWRFKISKKEVAPHRKTIHAVGDKLAKQSVSNMILTIILLADIMTGVKPPPKKTQLFQLTCWPEGQKVPNSTNSLVELMNMVERLRQKTGYGSVLVVSPDGMSRAGVYCAANACIEQVVQHGEVDVFQAVKTVRLHRSQLVNNITEYKYCYDVVLHYVLHFLQKNSKKH